jgi:hypothetical protein
MGLSSVKDDNSIIESCGCALNSYPMTLPNNCREAPDVPVETRGGLLFFTAPIHIPP